MHYVATSGEPRDLARAQELLVKARDELLPRTCFRHARRSSCRIGELHTAADLEAVLSIHAGMPTHRDVSLIDEVLRVEMRGEAERIGTTVSSLVLFAWTTRTAYAGLASVRASDRSYPCAL